MKKNIFCIILSLFSFFVLTCCSFDDQSLYKDEVHISQLLACDNFDPHRNNTIAFRQICDGTVWEKLLTLDKNEKPVPELCIDYSSSLDGRSFIFRLRRDVFFHNGKKMTADDVCASMNRWIKNYGPVRSAVGTAVVERLDTYTVHISLDKPFMMLPYFIAGAAQPAAITTEECCRNEDSSGYLSEYIGTGPYKITEWVPDKYVRLEKFTGYSPYGKKGSPPDGMAVYKNPVLNSIYYHFNTDEDVQVSEFLSGDTDVILNLTGIDAELIQDGPDVISKTLPHGIIGLVFNKRHGEGANLYFRQAVNAAVDCDALNRAAFGSLYKNDASYMEAAQKMWHTDSGSLQYNKHDIAAAKKLLLKAGYNGEEFRIIVCPANNLDRTAAVLKQQLEEAGITVRLVIFSQTAFLKARNDPNSFDMFITTFASSPVPALNIYYDSDYPGWTDDAVLRKKISELEGVGTEAERIRLWTEIQAYSWEYLPMINTGHYMMKYAWTTRLKNVIHGRDGIYLWNASLLK